jgi:hypothetical protein
MTGLGFFVDWYIEAGLDDIQPHSGSLPAALRALDGVNNRGFFMRRWLESRRWTNNSNLPSLTQLPACCLCLVS